MSEDLSFVGERAVTLALENVRLNKLLALRSEIAWDNAILEAYDCGHLHYVARDEMLARNPYRGTDEDPA